MENGDSCPSNARQLMETVTGSRSRRGNRVQPQESNDDQWSGYHSCHRLHDVPFNSIKSPGSGRGSSLFPAAFQNR
ncbi:hypothetical protein BD413DRAFT_199594 [Trametes elegans]|nr:hypothetical protein BD413DRAFT_199594 [Trametes elegans]